jgi:very-short-patch-repair endonuclease
MAAVLACGEGAVLSHADAATLHNLRQVGSGAIDVTATSRRTAAGIRCHRVRALDPHDVTIIDGIPVTTLERTLVDLAETMHPQRFADLLERAQQERTFDLLRIEALIARSPGRRGIKPLRTALAALTDEPAWTQSWLERRLRELTRAHDLPMPRTNQYVCGELVDAVWPDQRLVVEVDGWKFHKTRRAFENDRRRDTKLVAAGWRVLRITARRLRDAPLEVAAELSRLLRAGPWPSPAR